MNYLNNKHEDFQYKLFVITAYNYLFGTNIIVTILTEERA